MKTPVNVPKKGQQGWQRTERKPVAPPSSPPRIRTSVVLEKAETSPSQYDEMQQFLLRKKSTNELVTRFSRCVCSKCNGKMVESLIGEEAKHIHDSIQEEFGDRYPQLISHYKINPRNMKTSYLVLDSKTMQDMADSEVINSACNHIISSTNMEEDGNILHARINEPATLINALKENVANTDTIRKIISVNGTEIVINRDTLNEMCSMAQDYIRLKELLHK